MDATKIVENIVNEYKMLHLEKIDEILEALPDDVVYEVIKIISNDDTDTGLIRHLNSDETLYNRMKEIHETIRVKREEE